MSVGLEAFSGPSVVSFLMVMRGGTAAGAVSDFGFRVLRLVIGKVGIPDG
jgi:hypothetical protein